MAKRIEFLAPVEAMRGNLSGSQELEYAENNNPAYDAPVGRLNYARNYQTRYIGAKRSSSGLKYFSVKTKNAVNLSTRAKMVMALLGGTGACRAAIKKAGISDITAIYLKAKEIGMTSAKNVDQYIYDIVYSSLESKYPFFTFAASGAVPASVRFRNPWVYTNQPGGVALTIKDTILVKFWTMLAVNPVQYIVDGIRGIAHTGDTFNTAYLESDLNLLGLKVGFVDVEGTSVECICMPYESEPVPDQLPVLTKAGIPVQSGAAIENTEYTVVYMPHND